MSANPSLIKHVESHPHAHSVKPGSSFEYRIVYSLVFMVCLAITGLCRLLPRNRHPWMSAGDDGSRSLWSEARNAADSTVPYVFQQ